MKTITLGYLAAVLIVFIACDSSQKATAGDVVNAVETVIAGGIPVGVYTISTIAEKDYSGKALTLHFDTEHNSVHGTTDCNGISSAYEINGNQITFGPVMATKMYCEGKMDAERELSQTLGNVFTYSIEKGGILNLYDREGNIILTATK